MTIKTSQLKCMRKYRRLTQKQLGEMIGADQARISAYERGERKPKIQMLMKLANALDCIVVIQNNEVYFQEV